MTGNIIKLAFLLSYLTMLIGVVTGIPYLAILFRSIMLMVLFSVIGLFLRWYLLKTISQFEVTEPSVIEEEEGEEEVFVIGEDAPSAGLAGGTD